MKLASIAETQRSLCNSLNVNFFNHSIQLAKLEYSDIRFHSKIENGVDVYTKADIYFPHATASITLGIGVKTEGNLVISGTKGYIYVPAPWWLTDFFEVRYEDQSKNKKYFYSYDGEGLRYEIQEFISMIVNKRKLNLNP